MDGPGLGTISTTSDYWDEATPVGDCICSDGQEEGGLLLPLCADPSTACYACDINNCPFTPVPSCLLSAPPSLPTLAPADERG